MEMELYCFDDKIQQLGIIENYNSLRWLEEYNGLGEFQLVAEYTKNNVEMLQQEYLLFKSDGETCGVLEYINYKGDVIECRGRLTNKFLHDRIVINTINIANIEQGLRNAIQQNCIEREPVFGLILGSSSLLEDYGERQTTFETCFTLVNDYKQIGFKVSLDLENKKHVVKFYKGNDRSDQMIFNKEFENIFDVEINQDSYKYKNIAYVYGQGEGSERQRTIVDLSNGRYKRELYVDAKDISNIKEEGKSDNEDILFTEEEYKQLLAQRGLEKLLEQIEENTFKCNIKTEGAFEYKKDFFLGDFVICKSDKFNVEFKVRISAIQEIYSQNGYEIVATFGELGKEGFYG